MKLPALAACSALMFSSALTAADGASRARAESHPGDTVLLLHGLGRTRLSLLPLAHALEREGFHVINRSYPWRSRTLEELATSWLPAVVAENFPHTSADPSAPAPRLHIVTHSMGGILVRLWLRQNPPPPHLGRIAMLGPPHRGSPLADRLSTSRLLRFLVGPNGPRLGTGATSLPLSLGPWPATAADLGILAGNRSLLPLPATLLPPPHDGKVTVASTHLAGARDHRTLPCSHTFLPLSRATHAHIVAFLRTGAFPSS